MPERSRRPGVYPCRAAVAAICNASAITDVTSNFRVSADLAHDDGFRDDSGFDQQKLTLQHHAELGQWEIESLVAINNLNQETAGFLQTGQEVVIDGETVVVPDESYRFRELIETNSFPEAFRDTQALRVQNQSCESKFPACGYNPPAIYPPHPTAFFTAFCAGASFG